jgi:hypothetical protein
LFFFLALKVTISIEKKKGTCSFLFFVLIGVFFAAEQREEQKESILPWPKINYTQIYPCAWNIFCFFIFSNV